MQTENNKLAAHLREIFNGDPWYGDNISKKLSSITAAQANWHPHPEANSIAQVLKHMISWKQLVIAKLERNDTRQIEMDSEEDWDRGLAIATDADWQRLVNEFTDTHEKLLKLLKNKTDETMTEQVSGRTYNMAYLAHGIYEHNLYHLGQIGYIQGLWKKQNQ